MWCEDKKIEKVQSVAGTYNLDFDLLALFQAHVLHGTHRHVRELVGQLLALQLVLELVQRHVEVEGVVALIEGNTDERVPALGVCYSQHEVAATVQRTLNRGVIRNLANCEYLVACIHKDNRCNLSFCHNL